MLRGIKNKLGDLVKLETIMDPRFPVILLVLILLAVFLITPLPDAGGRDLSTLIKDVNGNVLRVFLNRDEQWLFPPDKDIIVSEKLKKAVICFEDKSFYFHPGVNPLSVVRAAYQNLKKKTVVSGASTITMQLARILDPKERNISNKLVEILQAFKLEMLYSKKRILRLYLENAPYGGNIIGFQAASLKYFNKPPNSLTWAEAALLAVLPNAPGLMSPGKNKKLLIRKRNGLLKKLFLRGQIEESTYNLAVTEPAPAGSIDFKMEIPHLSRLIEKENKGVMVKTFINIEYQKEIERIIDKHMQFLSGYGIKNCAVLVAETRTGKVSAYLGSQNFYDESTLGKVDGVTSPRSSGSILKPFLYALSFDRGYLLPESKIKDVPVHYGTFNPENCNLNFSGLVSVEEALIRSLNVPAVVALEKFGIYDFYNFLEKAGVSTLFRTPDDYGLTLILGGAEVTLFDLVSIYRSLGRYGLSGNLKLIDEENLQDDNEQLISKGSAYLVLQILKQLKRPGLEAWWESFNGAKPFAWKTGTSYGNRDAWALGVSPKWTIGIWVGNFDGRENINLGSSTCSAPILFDIFNYLPAGEGENWFEPPSGGLRPVRICADSGYRAGENCKNTLLASISEGAARLKKCPYCRSVFVNIEETEEVCSLCWEQGKYKKVKKIFYPPDVVQYLSEGGVITERMLPHKKDCPGNSRRDVMNVIYPQENASIFIPRDLNGKLQKINLRAAHIDPGKKIYWYIDNVYRGCTACKHSMAVELTSGKHSLEIIDSDGERAGVTFYSSLRED